MREEKGRIGDSASEAEGPRAKMWNGSRGTRVMEAEAGEVELTHRRFSVPSVRSASQEQVGPKLGWGLRNE